jgi:3-hydroxyacyl-CoA dehydrogenase/enoyl-CoA hydratase/3-hydroxybutyryl-CoA epimerase
VYQCINHWGAKNFVARANELSKKYGKRFDPPKLLKDKAKKNELFV